MAPCTLRPPSAADTPAPVSVVVDPTGVTFFGSAGISLLVGARIRARTPGVDPRLASPPVRVRRLLGPAGTQDLPPVHATTEEALVDDRR
ncbi:STAS domain-containing protein [Nocardiopsis alborubida]|uniref:STAS domain-containing protein n=1 Tax=Nocardiopsis alborubida TaxID=146802 RepID=A0A7X6MD06_9ACTN|nr:STAS domain-containing protein [Nocardiopsis alborubida]